MTLLTIYLVGYALAYLTLYREDKIFYDLEKEKIPNSILVLNLIIAMLSWIAVILFWYVNFRFKQKN